MANENTSQDDSRFPSLLAASGTSGTAQTRKLTAANVAGALDVYNLGPAGTTSVAPNLPVIAGTPADVGTFLSVRLTDGAAYYTASSGGSFTNVVTGTQNTLGTVGTVVGAGVVTTVTSVSNLASGTLLSSGTTTGVGVVSALTVGTVGGKAASGAAAVANPVQIAGTDAGGTIYSPLVTTAGALTTTGTVTGVGVVTSVSELVKGTVTLVPTVTTVSNLTNGSINILTGTLQSSGTTTGVGVVSNLTNGSVNILTGTLQSSGTTTGVGVVSNLTNGSVNILTGTLQSSGTTTGVGVVSVLTLGTTQRVRASAGTVAGTTVGTTNVLIIASNASRKEWWLVPEGTTILYWGVGTGVTAGSAGNGFPLVSNQLIADDVYTGAVYGIVLAGSVFCKYGEF